MSVEAKETLIDSSSRDEELPPRPAARLSLVQWAVIAVLVASGVDFLARHFTELSAGVQGALPEDADRSGIFFRLILPAEIILLMLGTLGLRRRLEPITPRADRLMRIAIPLTMLALLVLNWQAYCDFARVPHYILPSPARVVEAFQTDWEMLLKALRITLGTTFTALAIALATGVALAIFMAQSRWVELALFPYAVILQVTPIVAIAPLLLIYTSTTEQALLICAWLVAFFPILSNTAQGLHSTDHNLLNLFELYGASRWQTLIRLRLPNALPFFLAGLRIAGGLALIAAVVAEFAAGTAGENAGLAFRLIEAQHRLNIP